METRKSAPLLVSVLGWSGTGKTTLILEAIHECRLRGLQAGTIKKSAHEAELPPDAKDSSRFFDAGATRSIYLNHNEMIELDRLPAALDQAAIAALFPGTDLVFCEGLEIEGAPRILLGGDAREPAALKRPLTEIDALISDEPCLRSKAEAAEKRAFSPLQVAQFIDYLISWEK